MNTTELDIEPKPRPKTRWTNPTDHEQALDLSVPCNETRVYTDAETGARRQVTITQRSVRVTIAPGETTELSADYDLAIHRIHLCGHDGCKMYCKRPADAGPKAVVVGGMAPLLQREGQRYSIDSALIPRPVVQRSVAVAPGDVTKRIAAAAAADEEDPALERARARRKAAAK